MDKYVWKLINGDKVEIGFSPHFDNLITKFRHGKGIEGVFLMDCGIVRDMPRIMRYCFEKSVNLRKNPFLRKLPYADLNKMERFDKDRIKQDFQLPLRVDVGVVRYAGEDLVIYSSPDTFKGYISFDKEDVPEFVEGIIKSFGDEILAGAKEKCLQTVQYYHQCLDEGLL